MDLSYADLGCINFEDVIIVNASLLHANFE
ncbi:hypothetical protein [cyanobacterium endosymbiont of Rhopalodia gibberula]